MTDHLRMFEPYERKGAHHEDALTRAFLLVLRSVPVAHSAWLHLVDEAHRTNRGSGVPRLHELTRPKVAMQTAHIPETARRVISLVQTDEEFIRESNAVESERRQVLDGVVTYNDFAIVIENKPDHGNIWEAQLDFRLPAGAALDPRVGCVTWKSIVAAWGRLLEAGHVGPGEAVIIEDFLDYVETHFPRLRPYSKVALCGPDRERLTRRCEAVLRGICLPSDHMRIGKHPRWGWNITLDEGQCAKQIALLAMPVGESFDLVVEYDPADTMSQGKVFYRTVRLDGMLQLREGGWRVQPNFHVMHMRAGLLNDHTLAELVPYWNVWTSRSDLLRQWKREEFMDRFAELVSLGILSESTKPDYEKCTIRSERTYVNPCPGIRMRWHFRLDEASMLDERCVLEDTVRGKIEEAAGVLGLRLPW